MPGLHYSISPRAPIAVFDSGLGGLTVVRALRCQMPDEDVVYFGDAARVPYGNKSAETITRFTREICQFLLHLQPKLIIAACNTVSAIALPELRDELPVPILGVVEPSAIEAVEASRKELIAVLGTEATIASCAFERAIRRHNPRIRVVQQSCPLLVPIVEEGRMADDPITRQAIHDYLAPIKRLQPDVILLGCTHYPMLKPAFSDYFDQSVALIDSGEAVVSAAHRLLSEQNLLSPATQRGTVQCYVSDYPQRFAAIGTRFLGESLPHVIRASAEAWHYYPPTAATMGASA
ncbi:MAG: Glutamate racemase [Phycisphaerae bacterium]|nr:Glutamate racemase [Phycisphaerae bacterium]